MANSNKLLDTFTQLLAYMGDEGAQDGYINSNISIRDEPISSSECNRIVNNMRNYIAGDAELYNVPEDIMLKVVALKELANNPMYLDQKNELLEYMAEYNAENGMRGGLRRRKSRRRTQRKRSKTDRKRSKTNRKRNAKCLT